jgi:hypothetical protein
MKIFLKCWRRAVKIFGHLVTAANAGASVYEKNTNLIVTANR